MNSTVKIQIGDATWELLRDGDRVGASGPYAVKIATECHAAVRRSLQQSATVDGVRVDFMSMSPIEFSDESAWFRLRWRERRAPTDARQAREFGDRIVGRAMSSVQKGQMVAITAGGTIGTAAETWDRITIDGRTFPEPETRRGTRAWLQELAGPDAKIAERPAEKTVLVTLPSRASLDDVATLGAKLSRAVPIWCSVIVCRASEADERRAREAPLVALVNAVPEGLDPIGWRAAVLFWAETHPGMVSDYAPHIASWLRHRVDDRLTAVYLRAIAPQGPRPQPERRKSPGLPLDVEW